VRYRSGRGGGDRRPREARMATVEELKARVTAEIDRRAGEVVEVSDLILRHPESGIREKRTAEFVAGRFRAMGLDCREGLALTGF
jgi:metal-dependent amidase/aminoacylase/carboxypeptidase family protein